MTDDPREIEIKFDAPQADIRERLRQEQPFAPMYILSSAQESVSHDTYLDTPSYSLLRAGFSLRLRQQGEVRVITIKSLVRRASGPLHDRSEWEAPLSPGFAADKVKSWSPELRQRLGRILGKGGKHPWARLHPIARLSQERHKRMLTLSESVSTETPLLKDPIGELSIDTVQVFAPETNSHTPLAQFAEVEFELTDESQRQHIQPIAQTLAEELGLLPAEESKVQRALRAIVSHPLGYAASANGIQPQMTMAEAARLIWRQQLMEMILWEAGARTGADIEPVHQMRVSTRKARAAVSLFAAYFKPGAIRSHVKALRHTGRLLGAVRDRDVALLNLGKYAGNQSPKERKGLQAIARTWKIEHKTARKSLLAWLDSPAYQGFLADFDAFCRTPGAGVKDVTWQANQPLVPAQVRHILPAVMTQQYAAMRSYEVLFEEMESVPEEALHALRIEGKRLRYCLEFTKHLLGEPGAALIANLRDIQDHLGDLNDAAVSRGQLQAMQEQGEAVAAYIVEQQGIVDTLRSQFPEHFWRFVGSANRSALAEAVARL